STILLVRSRHYASNWQPLQIRHVGNSAPQLWLPDSLITFGPSRSFCTSCLFPSEPTLTRETTEKGICAKAVGRTREDSATNVKRAKKPGRKPRERCFTGVVTAN